MKKREKEIEEQFKKYIREYGKTPEGYFSALCWKSEQLTNLKLEVSNEI